RTASWGVGPKATAASFPKLCEKNLASIDTLVIEGLAFPYYCLEDGIGHLRNLRNLSLHGSFHKFHDGVPSYRISPVLLAVAENCHLLEKLRIHYMCYSAHFDNEITEVFRNSPKLRDFDFYRTQCFTTNAIRALWEHCRNIRILKVSCRAASTHLFGEVPNTKE